MFLKNGNIVFGIEPNREMREAGEELLREHANFRSIAATAEATMLPNESVDFVVAGQAFHWFDPNQTKEEFQRIIRPEGYVVLIWNERQEATLFAEDYQRLLDKYSIDLAQVGHKTITSTSDATLERFFLPHGFSTRTFDNYQLFDYAGLEGRLLSSSYIPLAGDPSFEPMLAELHSIFDRHQLKGAVEFKYDTRVFYGRLK
jgi:SAM-dependent methyltransferase